MTRILIHCADCGKAVALYTTASGVAVDEFRPPAAPEAVTAPETVAALCLSIERLDLSARPYNALKYANDRDPEFKGRLQTVGQLVQRTRDELLRIKNMGARSLDEIEEELNQLGLKLRVSRGSNGKA
jgi:DNA-directed RNA polymerase subunit alpha